VGGQVTQSVLELMTEHNEQLTSHGEMGSHVIDPVSSYPGSQGQDVAGLVARLFPDAGQVRQLVAESATEQVAQLWWHTICRVQSVAPVSSYPESQGQEVAEPVYR